jgi:hypothetical protein
MHGGAEKAEGGRGKWEVEDDREFDEFNDRNSR